MRAFPKARFVFSDNNLALQNMWLALKDGWEPPKDYITAEDYAVFKARQDPRDPMTAFVGFGYSYGGKWFAGFAKPNDNVPGGRDLGPYGGTMRKARPLRERDVVIICRDWEQAAAVNAVIYYDPPYVGKTKQHRGVSYIDPRLIEDHARSMDSCACYASEFGEVFQGRVVLDMGNTDMLVNGGEKKNANELLVRIA